MKLFRTRRALTSVGMVIGPAIFVLFATTAGTVFAQSAQGTRISISQSADPWVPVPISPIRFGTPYSINDFGEPLYPLVTEAASTELSIRVDNLAQELPSEEEQYLQRQFDITAYETMVEDMEGSSGAWDAGLPEELMMMGDLLQQQGEFERALDIFTRAAHINRVNFGLISIEQIAPLEKIVETHMALNQWEEADQRQRYAYYIQSRAFENSDPRLIPALDKLARWNLLTFRLGLGGGEPTVYLTEAYRLFRAASTLVSVHFGRTDPRYVDYQRDMTRAAFNLAIFGSRSNNDLSWASGSSETLAASTLSGSPIARLNGFNEGEHALRNIYELYSSPRMSSLEDLPMRRAQALAELADWYLLFNRRQTAFRTYAEAYDILAQIDEELAVSMFDKIVPLPGFMDEEEHEQDAANALANARATRRGYIDVTLDISQYGRASNIALHAVEPAESNQIASNLMRRARAMTFRPRIEGGAAVEVKEARLRFPFWY